MIVIGVCFCTDRECRARKIATHKRTHATHSKLLPGMAADEVDEYLCFGDEIAMQLIPQQSEATPHIGYLSVRFGST